MSYLVKRPVVCPVCGGDVLATHDAEWQCLHCARLWPMPDAADGPYCPVPVSRLSTLRE